MKRIIASTLFILIFTSLNAQTEILNKAINELSSLQVDKYKDERNKPIIDKILKSTQLIHGLNSEGRFDVLFFESDDIIVDSNIQLVLNEKGDGFNLQVPVKLLSNEYYDLLLSTLAKHFIQVYNIFTISNYYQIYNNNILERFLYDMDNTFIEYVLLTEYIDGKYPINSKWCKTVIDSQNNDNLRLISKGLYFVDNKIVYKIYGLFRKYSDSGDLSHLTDTWDYINDLSKQNQNEKYQHMINLNSITFVIHYLNYTEVAVKYNSELQEDGSRNMLVKEIGPHTKLISQIQEFNDNLKTELDSDFMTQEYNNFQEKFLIQ